MYRSYMGPRGRRIGHGGSVFGILAGVFGLMFGGWIILAVLGGLLGAGVMVLGSVFALLGKILSWIVAPLFTTESFAVGVAIGLIWTAVRRMNEARPAEDRETAAAPETAESTEPEIIETRHYSFRA